jgi:hypothetical protein
VADLVPLERSAELVGRESVLRQLGGVLGDDRTLMADIAAGVEGEPRVPFG